MTDRITATLTRRLLATLKVCETTKDANGVENFRRWITARNRARSLRHALANQINCTSTPVTHETSRTVYA